MARNRHRTSGPINRVLAVAPESDPRLFAAAPVTASSGYVKRTRVSTKGRGLWASSAVSPYYRTVSTHDARWSRTVSSEVSA